MEEELRFDIGFYRRSRRCLWTTSAGPHIQTVCLFRRLFFRNPLSRIDIWADDFFRSLHPAKFVSHVGAGSRIAANEN